MSDNPYEVPESDVQDNEVENSDFRDVNWKDFKKLYYRSCNITALAGLWVIGILILTAVAIFSKDDADGLGAAFLGAIIIFNTITVIGVIQRNSWGRGMGIASCCLMLINIPIGTILGIVGLFAFIKCPELFGENRILHRDLKTEFKYRKKNKIFT